MTQSIRQVQILRPWKVSLKGLVGGSPDYIYCDYHLINFFHSNEIEAMEVCHNCDHRHPRAVVQWFFKHRTLKCRMGLVADRPPFRDLNFSTKEEKVEIFWIMPMAAPENVVETSGSWVEQLSRFVKPGSL